MPWEIEYYECEDGRQPAEEFEDNLMRRLPKLASKVDAILEAVEQNGQHLGGGYIEPCRGYGGLWETRAIFNNFLAREMFGFDGQRVVLLHGYVKRVGEKASQADLEAAHGFWGDYEKTRKVSPEAEE